LPQARRSPLTSRPDLRERQRNRLLNEIREASFSLLHERGDEVSVGDISERVGISERTFYRHFATREDALLGWIDDTAEVVHERLRHHAPGDAVGRVLCDAFIDALPAGMEPAHWQALRVVFSSPRLFNAYSERQRRWEAAVAEVIAERLGVSVRSDRRPGVWSAIAFAIATRVSHDSVMSGLGPDQAGALREAFVHAAEFMSHPLP